MKLSREQEHLLSDWLRKKVEHHSCQLCQGYDWKFGELILPADHDASERQWAGAMVQLVCQNCAQVILLDVKRIPYWSVIDSSHPDLM